MNDDRTFMSMKDALQIVLYATKVSGLIMVEVSAGMLKLIHKSNKLKNPIIRGEVASTADAEGPLEPYDKFARAVQRIIDPEALEKSGFCPFHKDTHEQYEYLQAIAAGKTLPKTQKMVLALGRVRSKAKAARAVQFDNGLECVGFVSYRDMKVRDPDSFFLDVPLSDQSEKLRDLLQKGYLVTELSVVCTSESTDRLRSGARVMDLQVLYVMIKEFKRKCSAVYMTFPESDKELKELFDLQGFYDITDEVADVMPGYLAMVLLPSDDRVKYLAGDYVVLNRLLKPETNYFGLTTDSTKDNGRPLFINLKRVCPFRNQNGIRKCV